ncbi:hypothetical protein KCP70_10850 [Salmonella enterica subsp. enterica]|nr:hypothetical protein KCP70_10850 [Salmonella enterica subsp. enterica]
MNPFVCLSRMREWQRKTLMPLGATTASRGNDVLQSVMGVDPQPPVGKADHKADGGQIREVRRAKHSN